MAYPSKPAYESEIQFNHWQIHKSISPNKHADRTNYSSSKQEWEKIKPDKDHSMNLPQDGLVEKNATIIIITL